ncbi:hypothetical protein KKA13_03820 [Patescibacteria group bacterium]|nr:hypothetical protein [Patescibacteria group bacterium]MBU1612873.1 hypothetical protein [Patescibacteria group bacterium]
MKNYSSNRAQKGKTAYRTPSRFKVQKSQLDSRQRDNLFNQKFSIKKTDNFYDKQ